MSPSPPKNEPVLTYAPGTPERVELKAELVRQAGAHVGVPLVLGEERIVTENPVEIRAPHDHSLVLGTHAVATTDHVARAIDAALPPCVNRASPSPRLSPAYRGEELIVRPDGLLANTCPSPPAGWAKGNLSVP